MQPIVELFLVVGSLEIVCRAWEDRTDLTYPKSLIAAHPATPHDPDAPEAEEPPLDRAAIVTAVVAGHLTQDQAAVQAGRTPRTIRRWLAAERSSPA